MGTKNMNVQENTPATEPVADADADTFLALTADTVHEAQPPSPPDSNPARIASEYADMLARIAFQNLGSRTDAEDVVQDVFLKLMKKRPVFETSIHEKAWLIRVTINACKDMRKTAWFRRTVPLEDYDLQDNRFGHNWEMSENNVMAAVQKLPEKYRSVTYLYYFEGMKVSEIAEILKQKENTVMSWLHRARSKLKIQLELEGSEKDV